MQTNSKIQLSNSYISISNFFPTIFQVDIIDGKASESDLDLSLEYDSQLSKELALCDKKLPENISVARREPEGKDNDSINTTSSVNADCNKMVPLGEIMKYCRDS